MAEGASVPALGLSNKAVFDVDKQIADNPDDRVRIVEELYKDIYFSNIELNRETLNRRIESNLTFVVTV